MGIGDWEGPKRLLITCLAVFRDQKRHDPAFAGPQVDPDIGGRIGIRPLSESRFPNPQSRPYRSSLLDMSSSATTSTAAHSTAPRSLRSRTSEGGREGKECGRTVNPRGSHAKK